MAVRFIIGRAGSGKTHRLLESVRERLRESATEGPRLILLVPEQSTFQIERALIETPDIAAYARCDVLGFQRLAHRIFVETGSDPRRTDQTIGRLGRLMVIRRLIRFERHQLKMLGRVADKPGLVRRVSDTLDELLRRELVPDDLLTLAERLDEDQPLAAARLHDMGRLYAAYLDYLEQDRIDPAQFLTLAAARLKECPTLREAEVWVDGFAGFTEQEMGVLVALAERAGSVEITLLMDPRASAATSSSLPGATSSLFARTERTLVKLREAFTTHGISMEDTFRLDPSKMPRFAEPALRRMEQFLFRSQSGGASETESARPERIRIVEAEDRRAEVREAVLEIRRLTREGDAPMRYREIAVIVRDLESYHHLLTSAMRVEGIPFFLDRRRPMTDHPFVMLLRGLLELYDNDMRLDDVREILKTGLLPLDGDDADLLENYLLAHNIEGRAVWSSEWSFQRMYHTRRDGELEPYQKKQLQHINMLRERLWALLRPWLDCGRRQEGEPRGREWAEGFVRCLDRLGIAERLTQWARESESDGRVDEANAHLQVWHDWLELIDEFVRALGEDPMTIHVFHESLDAGLAEFDLGLAPPTVDQVLIGSIERSRHPEIRAALILGFDEKHFPKRRSEDPLLGDRERELLEEEGREIGPSRKVQILDERMLAYIALTRASEQVWISLPRCDEDGSTVEPSPFLEELVQALPGLKVESLPDPWQTRRPSMPAGVSDLGGRLAWEMRSRAASPDEDDSPKLRKLWNGMYQAACRQTAWQTTLRQAMAGLAYVNKAELRAGAVDDLIPSHYTTSISRLERFAACPFAHFSEYMLRLRPRLEPEVADVELGTICHAVLETFIERLAAENIVLGELEDDAISERIDAAADDVLPRMTASMLSLDPRSAYLFEQSRALLRRSARWQRDAARAGAFRPMAMEWAFGGKQGDAPAVTIHTPGGRTIQLRGYIDRVDVAELGDITLGMVIDYKRSLTRSQDFVKAYYGLALQLAGYLLALREVGASLTGRPIQPVAAFFLPLLQRNERVAHPDAPRNQEFQYRGLLRLDGFPHLDRDGAAERKSAFMSARITKEGKPYKGGDLLENEQFDATINHAVSRMGELADGILDGKIAVSPFRLRRQMPCSFCPYSSVCRFESEFEPARHLDTGDRSDVLDQMKLEVRDD